MGRVLCVHRKVYSETVPRYVPIAGPCVDHFLFGRFESGTRPIGLRSMGLRGKGADGPWLCCTTDDTVYDAVKSNKLITVTPDNKVLRAMQLMTGEDN